jgi:peptidoglycan/xylan/chitin deacetylase (PgdA/CDA1 family)
MKNKKIIALAVALVLLVPAFSYAANLVPNGNLESGTTNAPTGWSADYWGTLTGKFTYPVAGDASARAARVEITAYTSGDAKWAMNSIPVTPGTTYQIGDRYRSNVASEVDVSFIVNGQEVYDFLAAPASTGGNWATYTGSIKAPAGATSMSILHLIEKVGYLELDNMSVTTGTTPPPPPVTAPVINSFTASPTTITQGQSATLSWSASNATSLSINQNVGTVTGTSKIVTPTATTTYTLTATNSAGSVTKTVTVNVIIPQTPPPPPPTTNLIQNGNLESGTTNAPTGWSPNYWGTLSGKFTYPVTGKGGGKAAQVQITSYTKGDAKWFFKHVTVSSHTIYKFSLDYLSTAKTNVSIEYKMSDGTFTYQWLSDLPAASSWKTYTREVTVPKGAVSFSILPALVGVGSLTIDNATLVALPANQFSSGMVTFVFDDGLLSQYTNALPILTAAGYKASFGIITTQPTSGNPAAMTWAQIKDLLAKGHEVNSHSRTHPALTTLNSTQLTSEVKGSYDDLVAQGITPKTFVYPLGDVNATVEAAVKAAGYVGARGSYFGLNTTTTNDYNLYDIRLDKTSTLANVQKYIDQAVEDKRWLVFELHDVLPSGGDDFAITTAFFQSVVDYLKSKGVTVLTLKDGIAK